MPRARRPRSSAGCSMERCRYGGGTAQTVCRAAFTRRSASTASRCHGRTARGSLPDKHSHIAKPAGSAGLGPWREAQRHALDYFRKHFIAADATVVSVVDLDGEVSYPSLDLYNQAFALLAYASGHRTFGEADGWRRQAVALRTTLEQSYAHPLGSFVEDRAGRLPQRSNPHMHLLEAALAWIVIDD